MGQSQSALSSDAQNDDAIDEMWHHDGTATPIYDLAGRGGGGGGRGGGSRPAPRPAPHPAPRPEERKKPAPRRRPEPQQHVCKSDETCGAIVHCTAPAVPHCDKKAGCLCRMPNASMDMAQDGEMW